jgi:bifunctional DNA-binding transcriptional regulator/antitoxin component of YhaV-PrlF toxin-antitoxin module
MNSEFRKLGGPGGNRGSLTLPAKFLKSLKWEPGIYLSCELDESRQQIVLRKAR